MTAQTVKNKINELQESKSWNYLLIITAILSGIIAIRNVTIYTKAIKSGEKLINK